MSSTTERVTQAIIADWRNDLSEQVMVAEKMVDEAQDANQRRAALVRLSVAEARLRIFDKVTLTH